MKFLLPILFLVSSLSFAASGSGNVSDVIGLGGIELTSTLTIPEANTDGYFTLYGGGSPGAGTFGLFFKNGSATGYKPTGGMKFKGIRVCGMSPGTASTGFQVTSSTTCPAFGDATITGGTPTYMAGAINRYALATAAANTWACYSTTFEIADTYCATYQWQSAGQAFIIYTGKEVAN
jgi:hypothetical protein